MRPDYPFLIALTLAATFLLLLVLLVLSAFRLLDPPAPAPAVVPAVHSLEYRPDGLRFDGRLPMPPMHSTEPQQITL